MSLEITGVIKKFLPVESGVSKSDKEWKKQSFIVVNNDGYEGREQMYCFEVFGAEKVENLTKYQKEGQEVKVYFNVKTNEWKDKFYTSLQSFRIEKLESAPSVPIPPTENYAPIEDEEDDLLF